MIAQLMTLAEITLLQLLGLFALFFFLGFILSILQRQIQGLYMRSVGWPGLYVTAWIGTPVHEFGHIIFAKIFRHKIENISLFKPNPHNGQLGHVHHSYHKYSLYKQIGNFFVGAGPLLFGPFFLSLLMLLLVPNAQAIFAAILQPHADFTELLYHVMDGAELFVRPENRESWLYWLFIYLAFSISSHMAPSKADRKGMWRGFFWLALLLFIINIIAFILGFSIDGAIQWLQSSSSVLTAFFLLALCFSVVHYIFALIFLGIPGKIMQGAIERGR